MKEETGVGGAVDTREMVDVLAGHIHQVSLHEEILLMDQFAYKAPGHSNRIAPI